MKNFISMRRGLGGGKATAEGLIESGTALIGSPRTVLAGIERMRERTGFGILVALLQFGILSDDLTRRNMDLFSAEVMPHLKGSGAAVASAIYSEAGWPAAPAGRCRLYPAAVAKSVACGYCEARSGVELTSRKRVRTYGLALARDDEVGERHVFC